jgi:hypothetical protein
VHNGNRGDASKRVAPVERWFYRYWAVLLAVALDQAA